MAFVAATNLPWFGAFISDNPEPHHSAVSVTPLPPDAHTGSVPGTQSWGHLLVAWSALLGVLALMVLVIPELVVRVSYDEASTLGFDWGAIVGLGLAVLASVGAWFAWATWTCPSLWGPHPSAD